MITQPFRKYFFVRRANLAISEAIHEDLSNKVQE